MFTIYRYASFFLFALTTGCASLTDQAEPPIAVPPVKTTPVKPTKPTQEKPTTPPSPAKITTPPVVKPAVLTDQQVIEHIIKLLPAQLQDQEGWAVDMQTAFKALQIQPGTENICAVISIIDQESSFQADPVVPKLPTIVRQEIEQRRLKYGIPQTVVDWMLSTTSSDRRSYNQRIDALKTEKELSDLVEEIVALVPAGKKLFSNYNPVHTGGAMQVSVDFAEAHARARPYPYPVKKALRDEVFSRRGGIYFGTAILLDYPTVYDSIIYRFADFNAGRYSSRNAAFQLALSRLSKKPLMTDGDLLRYINGAISSEPSSTLKALYSISKKLNMSNAEIQHDLQLEKFSAFERSTLYTRMYALSDQAGILPRFSMPEINLKSPKFSRKLTTKWFANRVYKRYRNCLQH